MQAVTKVVKPAKGTIPAGFANGGKVKPFSGVDSKAEETKEGRDVRSGKTSVKQYVEREMVEDKREGEPVNRAELAKKGAALASGKMTPERYAAMESKEKRADGGFINDATHQQGFGYASSLNGKNMKK
jgi:hypothetical protein